VHLWKFRLKQHCQHRQKTRKSYSLKLQVGNTGSNRRGLLLNAIDFNDKFKISSKRHITLCSKLMKMTKMRPEDENLTRKGKDGQTRGSEANSGQKSKCHKE